jgi:hypothetical protein
VLSPRRVARGARLTFITLHAWCALVLFDVVVLLGFHHVHERIRRCRVTTSRQRAAVSIDDVVWAVDEACVWYVKRAACLQRSAVLTWLLRRYGIAAELVIGYRPVPFESHAWVEVAGLVVNDRQQYQKFFAVLERL